MRAAVRRLLGAASAAAMGLSLAWLVPAGRSAAAGPGPVGVNADDVSVDAGGAVVATGHVAVTYGPVQATSDMLRFVRAAGTATFSGHVLITEGPRRATADVATLALAADASRVTRARLAGRASVESPAYHLAADEVEADESSRVLSAAGHVRVVARPDLVVTGGRARYDEASDHADVLSGPGEPARIVNGDGRVSGSRLELWRATGVAVVHGPVAAQVYGATVTGDNATIHLRPGTALVTGHVRVLRGRGMLTADRLTIDYQARRFVAEGVTHVSLPEEESESP